MCDYIIVGSGFFGSICAHELTKKGYNCYFIEQPLLDYGTNTYKYHKDNFFNEKL